jgi:quercetin dioxygenase-like cupin family protein
MMYEHTIEEAQNLAALYALGALQGDEAREFEEHLAKGCVLCTTEVEAFAPVVAELGHAAPMQEPPAELRTRILERTALEGLTQAHPKIEKDNQYFAGASWLDWAPLFPGVEVKLLSIDKERGYYTTLVRMVPGAIIPPHRHVEAEDSYMLEGEFTVSGVLMRPGDHCHAKPGSVHPVSTTTTGCVYVSVKSVRDEWLTAE